MGFNGNRADRHRARGEPPHDLGRGFHFLKRHRGRPGGLELQKTAERHLTLRLIVDDLRVFLIGLEAVVASRPLQLHDRFRGPHMLFAVSTPGVFAAGREFPLHRGVDAVGRAVTVHGFLHDFKEADTFDAGRRPPEVALDEIGLQANRLKDPRAAVAHQGRNTHLRHDLREALADRLHVIRDRGFFREAALRGERTEGGERNVRAHRLSAVPHEEREVLRLDHGAGFDDEADVGTDAFRNEVLVQGGGREEHRDRHAVSRHGAVRDDEDVVAALYGVNGLSAKRRDLSLNTLAPPVHGVRDIELTAPELPVRERRDVVQFRHIAFGQDRLHHLKTPGRIDVIHVKEIRLRADKGDEARHELLTDRVDRRVRDLSEELLKVVKERLIFLR